MSNDKDVTFILVRPGGVVTKPFADGAITQRIGLGYMHDPDDGVISEMKAGREPVPWQSAEVRDEAVLAVKARRDLDEETCAKLLKWIAATPYFEDI